MKKIDIKKVKSALDEIEYFIIKLQDSLNQIGAEFDTIEVKKRGRPKKITDLISEEDDEVDNVLGEN